MADAADRRPEQMPQAEVRPPVNPDPQRGSGVRHAPVQPVVPGQGNAPIFDRVATEFDEAIALVRARAELCGEDPDEAEAERREVHATILTED
jgi:hypothetical protein